MGRRAVLREAVLETLVYAQAPLSLADLTKSASKKLHRTIYPTAVLNSLRPLLKSKKVLRTLFDKGPVYVLAGRAFKESISESLANLISRDAGGESSKLIDNGETHEGVPYAVHIIPPQGEESVFERSRVYHQVDWEDPADGIGGLIINDFYVLSPEKQNGIAELVAWAYWCGVRDEVENWLGKRGPRALLDELGSLKVFLEGTVAKAEKEARLRDATADRAAYKILEITEKLIQLENLQDFLTFAFAKRNEVSELLSTILREQGNYISSGELIFNGLVLDVSKKFQTGLFLSGVKDLESLPRHMQASHSVWNRFLGDVLYTLHGVDSLRGVGGSLAKAKRMTKLRSLYAHDLTTLVSIRRVGALYVWGFHEIDSTSNVEFRMDLFPSWLEALKVGRLDHRVWLFKPRTFRVLGEAIRAVRSQQCPLPLRIDKEQWTLADVYKYYHRGKEEKFWIDLRNDIRDKMGPRNEAHFKTAVPLGFYSEFKKKESRTVESRLRKEEREVRSRLKSKRSRGVQDGE